MKRTILFTICMILMFAAGAYAGVWETVTGYVKGEAVSLVIGGLIGALGIFGISYKFWGQAAKELGEFVYQIYAATRTTSNGGKEITRAEMEKIIKEGSEVYPAVAAALASHKKNR